MSISIPTGVAAIGLAAALASVAPQAMAGVVFDLSPTNNTTYRTADSGVGQGVDVSADTTITDMAFYADLPNGGDAKFMIWDASNSTLLFSTTRAFAASNTQSWIDSGPMSFDLVAGDRYWFGVIADNNIDIGYIFPPVDYSANGLTAVSSGNVNYSGYDNPGLHGAAGAAEIGLQLSSGAAGVPEPATWGLMLAGVGLLGAALRSRKAGVLAA